MTPIVQLIISQIPSIVAAIKARHAADHPDAPPLTSETVIAGFDRLFASDIAKDELLRVALQAEIDGQ